MLWLWLLWQLMWLVCYIKLVDNGEEKQNYIVNQKEPMLLCGNCMLYYVDFIVTYLKPAFLHEV